MARRGRKRRGDLAAAVRMIEHVRCVETRADREAIKADREFVSLGGHAIRKRVTSDFALTSGAGRGDIASIKKRDHYRDSLRFIARHNAHVAAIRAGVRAPINYSVPHASTGWAQLTVTESRPFVPIELKCGEYTPEAREAILAAAEAAKKAIRDARTWWPHD